MFRLTVILIIASCILMNCKTIPSSGNADSLRFYVGNAANDSHEGISVFQFNPRNGKAKFQSEYEGITSPGYLNFGTQGRTLYAVHGVSDSKNDGISAFSLKPNGDLQFINSVSVEGRCACYLSATKSGNVLVSNYCSASSVLLPTDSSGKLGEASSVIQHKGSSINPERQKEAHAQYIQEGTGDLIYAADLGADKVFLYTMHNKQLVLNDPAYIKLHPGAGPRHLDFHQNGKIVFVLNELDGTVSTFNYESSNGSFSYSQKISTLPSGFDGYNKSADIHIHPSGNFLYASNRGDHNSIAVYRVDEANALLTLVEIETEAIAWPRNFAISPDGRHLLCANRDSDSVTIYDIDQSSGELTYNGNSVEVKKPICVKFGS